MAVDLRKLRELLDDLVCMPSYAEFDKAWAKFKKVPGHSVRMVNTTVPEFRWLNIFVNCYAYALGLNQIRRYQELVKRYGRFAIPDGSFVRRLIDDGLLNEIPREKAGRGKLVIYCDGDDPRHAGVVTTGTMRVRSKWGGNELFDHPLMHVPAPYG